MRPQFPPPNQKLFANALSLTFSMSKAEFSPTAVTLEDNGRFLSLEVEGVQTSVGGSLPFLAGAILKHPRCSFRLPSEDGSSEEFAVLTAEEGDEVGLGVSSSSSPISGKFTFGEIDFEGIRKIFRRASTLYAHAKVVDPFMMQLPKELHPPSPLPLELTLECSVDVGITSFFSSSVPLATKSYSIEHKFAWHSNQARSFLKRLPTEYKKATTLSEDIVNALKVLKSPSYTFTVPSLPLPDSILPIPPSDTL